MAGADLQLTLASKEEASHLIPSWRQMNVKLWEVVEPCIAVDKAKGAIQWLPFPLFILGVPMTVILEETIEQVVWILGKFLTLREQKNLAPGVFK